MAKTADFRWITRIAGQPDRMKTKHYTGLPPELTGGRDFRHEMNPASVRLIGKQSDGVFLYRFDSEGQVVGDTWHRSIEEAKEQAQFEYGNLISEWKQVPPEIEDVVQFASQV